MTHQAFIFHDVEVSKPEIRRHSALSETVLVRSWGERRRHYVWALAQWEVLTASHRWVNADPGGNDETLWFDPVEWAYLPVVNL